MKRIIDIKNMSMSSSASSNSSNAKADLSRSDAQTDNLPKSETDRENSSEQIKTEKPNQIVKDDKKRDGHDKRTNVFDSLSLPTSNSSRDTKADISSSDAKTGYLPKSETDNWPKFGKATYGKIKRESKFVRSRK